jgi:L-aminoadipate-semialdehyde dehydrogenase
VPDINNAINMVPVDHVTSRPRTRYNDFLLPLGESYGYKVESTPYLEWRTRLEQHVLEVGDNALFPLLHFVLDDLPTSTKSAELDDSNTRALLQAAGERDAMNVSEDVLGRYLAWLVKAGFLDAPPAGGKKALPELAGAAVAMGRSSGAV